MTTSTTLPGGTRALGDLRVTRFGYGAMQLAGPGVMGPPRDRDGALAVLRAAVDLGITHIDTSGAYGPGVVNSLIREALHPYGSDLRIATTAGFAELELSGADYYLMYAVPNFFFHYTMAYATARQAGVAIGKADFDGFHAYPPGFSFPRTGD